MTVANALAGIRTRLLTISSPQAFIKVYADPKEATSLGEMPCAVLAQAPQEWHGWHTEAMGGGSGTAKHDYSVNLYVFLGTRQTPIGELHARALPWSEAIFRALVADITLGGAVLHLGTGESTLLFRYQIRPIAWAADEPNYWGLVCLIPVVEKPSGVVMGP